MKESIVQLTMLLLTTFSCYGYFRRVEKAFGLRAEFAVFIVFTMLGMIMLLAGVLDILVPMTYGLFAFGLVLSAYSLLHKEPVKAFLQDGIIFLFLCCIFFFLLLYGSKLTHIDNFSHWGAILKLIIQRDALPANEHLVYFPSYPTGSSLLIYYFVRIIGIQAEWFWAYIQAVYLASCASTLFCFAEFKGRATNLVGKTVTGIVAMSLLCANIDLADLLVDTLIPMIALAGVAMCIYYREELTDKTIPLILVGCFLPMVKNSGYLFSVVIIVFALYQGRGTGRVRLPVLMSAGILGVNRIWAGHVKRSFIGGMGSYHAMSAESFQNSFSEKTAEDLIVISKTFIEAVLTRGKLLCLILCVLAVLLIIYRGEKWRELIGFAFSGVGVWIAWVIGIWGMYFFSMSLGEALRVAAFDRYYASGLVFCGGYFFILCMIAAQKTSSTELKFEVLLGCLLCLLTINPNYTFLERQSKREPYYALEMRNHFDSLVYENNIPSGLSYLVFSSEHNEILVRVMATYLLQPQSTLVCTDDELDGLGENWRAYDYYIVVDESENNKDFVRNIINKNEFASYTWSSSPS